MKCATEVGEEAFFCADFGGLEVGLREVKPGDAEGRNDCDVGDLNLIRSSGGGVVKCHNSGVAVARVLGNKAADHKILDANR